jgi:serine/threonine-protein kinase
MIVHRDVSPKNLMIGDDGVVRLIDLGLGKSKAQDWQTRDGRIMGAPGYMAPEQIRGEQADHRADLFSIGIVAHELITMRRYIEVSTDAVTMMKAALEKKFVPPSSLRSEVPRAIDEVLRRAVAEDRADRFDDADQLSAALEAVVKPASEAAIAAFLSQVLRADRDQRRAEVEELLEISSPHELGLEKTVVLAQRPGVRASAPIAMKASPPWRALLVAVLGVASLVLALVWALRPSPVEMRVIEPLPPPEPIPAPPVVSVQPVEVEAPEPVKPPRPPPAAKEKEKRAPVVRPPAPPPPARRASFEDRLSALDRRTQRMWKQLSPEDPRREAVAKLLRDLSLTKNALARIADPEGKRSAQRAETGARALLERDPEAELTALERRIDALEP